MSSLRTARKWDGGEGGSYPAGPTGMVYSDSIILLFVFKNDFFTFAETCNRNDSWSTGFSQRLCTPPPP